MPKLALLFIFVYTFCLSQITVPFRIGDKFGISDEQGKMLIPADYDIIDIINNGEFIATKKLGNQFSTTYILNNNIILKDTPYHYFESEGEGFFSAVKIKDLSNFYLNSNSHQNSYTDLYDSIGKKIFNKSFHFANIIRSKQNHFTQEKEKPLLKNEVLMLINDLEDKYKLLLLHKKDKVIVNTFFQNAIFVDTNYEQLPSTFKISYVLSGETVLRELTINFENGKIINQKTDIISTQRHRNPTYNSHETFPVPVPPHASRNTDSQKKSKSLTQEYKKNENIILEVKELKTQKRYTEPFTYQTIIFKNKKLSPELSYLIKSKGKLGFFNVHKKDWILPPSYDDIILDDGKCVFCNTYIVREGKIYRIIESDGNKKNIFLGKFEMTPHFFIKNYGKEGFHLIQLFDNEGKFFCYANQDGKMYFKK